MGRSIAVVAVAAAGAWIGIVAPGPTGVAHGDVITQWTFNSPGPGVDNNPTTGTLLPETGAGTLTNVGGTSNSGFAQGASADTSPTTGSNNNSSFEAQGYPPHDQDNKTAGIQIAVNTAGYQDIALSLYHWHESGASASFRIQYSTDGVNFTDGDGYTASSAFTFYLRSDDFSDVPGLDNNPNAKFRIVAEWQGFFYSGVGDNYVSNKRSRFDFVTVTGTPVPEPAATAAATLMLAGLALRRRR